jgi:hypothetical protein
MKLALGVVLALLTNAAACICEAQPRKPVAHKSATAHHPLGLMQLQSIQQKIGVGRISAYLTNSGWQYIKGTPSAEVDGAMWGYKGSAGPGRYVEILTVYFCNTADNEFCSRHDLHSDDGKYQHAYFLFYQTDKANFLAIKKSVEALGLPESTRLEKDSLHEIYTGEVYSIDFAVETSDSSPNKHTVTLRLLSPSE